MMQNETSAPDPQTPADTGGDAPAADAPAESFDPVNWIQSLDTDTLLSYGTSAIGALLLLFVGWIIARWVGSLLFRAMKRANVDMTLTKFLSKLAKWAILIFVGLTCLTMFGVEVTAFAAVIAAAGFAIGLAFQGTLSNFAAGVMLLVFRPFKVGDSITVAGVTGIVDEISIFVTEIDTFDNRRMIVPNGDVFGNTIENVSHHPRRRADVAVGTAYEADIDQSREVLMQAAKSVEHGLDDPEPAVVLQELGDSSINWSVRVWAKKEDFLAVKQELIRAVKYGLDNANIGIPYPQRDVHLIKDD